MKKYWFSGVCFLMAIALTVYSLIALIFFDEEILFYAMFLMSALSPTMLFVIVGFIDKGKEDDKNAKR